MTKRILWSSRWISGPHVEKCHVLCGHKRERQRDAGAAPPEPQLRHQLLPLHRHWHDHQLLRTHDLTYNNSIYITVSAF